MAKVLKYSKKTTEKIDIKGILDDEGKTIIYTENDEEKTVEVSALLSNFLSQGISLTIKTESDEELELDNKSDDKDSDEENYEDGE